MLHYVIVLTPGTIILTLFLIVVLAGVSITVAWAMAIDWLKSTWRRLRGQ